MCPFARENGYVSMKIEKTVIKEFPDRLFIGENRIYFIEFKKPAEWSKQASFLAITC